MKRILVLTISLLLVFGCIGPKPIKVTEGSANTTQPLPSLSVNTSDNSSIPTQVQMQNCSDYCNSLPHVQCIGTMNYSGSPPSCACSFNCVDNLTLPAPSPQVNVTTQVNLTNKTPSEVVDGEIEKIRNSFFMENSGTFTEHVYQWKTNSESNPSEVSFGTEYMDVAFNNQTDKNLKASGFITFETADEMKSIRGVAVFRSNSSILDDYVTFDVWYRQPLINKVLLKCYVYEKDEVLLVSGQHVMYLFECGKIN